MSGLRARSAGIAWCSPPFRRCLRAVISRRPRRSCTFEPDVGIVTVKPQPRAMVRELPGRIAPTRVADVRPQVSGIVVERLFRQGSEVKAGDPLYRIDPRPFEVEVQASEAALAKAEAVLSRPRNMRAV